jgi:hypothetical protein
MRNGADMKKAVVGFVAAAVILASMATASLAASSNPDPGGIKGFLSGCCFGLRTGADYNDIGTGKRDFVSWFLVGCCLGVRTQEDYRDGKDFHWRDIGRAIPYVNVIFAIWDGIDTANCKGRADLQKAYGVSYY